MKTVKQPTNKFAIAIAKDVLKQLKNLNLEPNQLIKIKDNCELRTTGDLKDCVDELQKICTVCEKGAVLLSKARLYNKVPMENVRKLTGDGDPPQADYIFKMSMDNLIDMESLDLLECAFEKVDFDWTYSSNDRKEAAIRFGKRYKTNRRCIKACMENVIANKGYFIPENGPAKKKVKKKVKAN